MILCLFKCSVESCCNVIGYIQFCTVHITPEFIMTTKDSVVKLFVKSVPHICCDFEQSELDVNICKV